MEIQKTTEGLPMITVTISPTRHGASLLRTIADALDGPEDELEKAPLTYDSVTESIRDEGYSLQKESDKPKRKRRTKAEIEAEKKGATKKAPAPKVEEELTLPDDDTPTDDEMEEKAAEEDLQQDDVLEDDDLDFGLNEKPAKRELTLKGDIIPAFRKYSEKHTREAAGKVLLGLGVKSVHDLQPSQYPVVLRTLGVA